MANMKKPDTTYKKMVHQNKQEGDHEFSEYARPVATVNFRPKDLTTVKKPLQTEDKKPADSVVISSNDDNK